MKKMRAQLEANERNKHKARLQQQQQGPSVYENQGQGQGQIRVNPAYMENDGPHAGNHTQKRRPEKREVDHAVAVAQTDRIQSYLPSLTSIRALHYQRQQAAAHKLRSKAPRRQSDMFPKRASYEKADWLTNDTQAGACARASGGANNAFKVLHYEILQFSKYACLDGAESDGRATVLRDLLDAVTSKWSRASVHAFGSFPTDLSIYSSDLDVSIRGLDEPLGGFSGPAPLPSFTLAPANAPPPPPQQWPPPPPQINPGLTQFALDAFRKCLSDADTAYMEKAITRIYQRLEKDGLSPQTHAWQRETIPLLPREQNLSKENGSPDAQPLEDGGYQVEEASARSHASQPMAESSKRKREKHEGDEGEEGKDASNAEEDEADEVVEIDDDDAEGLYAAISDGNNNGGGSDDGSADDEWEDVDDEGEGEGKWEDASSDEADEQELELAQDLELHMFAPGVPSGASGVSGGGVALMNILRPPRLEAEQRQRQLEQLKALASHIQPMGWCIEMEVRLHARVPIIVLKHRSGLEVDVSLGVSADEHTAIIEQLVASCGHDNFFPVCAVLKIFLAQQQLDTPFTGGIGSFKLYCMVVFVFQMLRKREVQAPPWATTTLDLGDVLQSFFNHFGQRANLNDATVLTVHFPRHSSDARLSSIAEVGREGELHCAFDTVHKVAEVQQVLAAASGALLRAVREAQASNSSSNGQNYRGAQTLESVASSAILARLIDADILAKERNEHRARFLRYPVYRLEQRVRVAQDIVRDLHRRVSFPTTIGLQEIYSCSPGLTARLLSYQSVAEALRHLDDRGMVQSHHRRPPAPAPGHGRRISEAGRYGGGYGGVVGNQMHIMDRKPTKAEKVRERRADGQIKKMEKGKKAAKKAKSEQQKAKKIKLA